MEKSLENWVFQHRSHWTTHEPEKAELEYTLSFLFPHSQHIHLGLIFSVEWKESQLL